MVTLHPVDVMVFQAAGRTVPQIALQRSQFLPIGERFHLTDADLQRLALSPQCLNAPGHLLARHASSHIRQRIHQRHHLLIELRQFLLQVGTRFVHILALACIELLAFLKLCEEILLILAELLDLFDDRAITESDRKSVV